MKVIATELGYDNVTLRNPGDQFDMPDDVFEGGGKPTRRAGSSRSIPQSRRRSPP
jgi:hypothetical protein